MRLRFTVLAAVLVAFASAAITSTAGAAPVHNRGLTIHATPHSIIAGEAVLIYGRLRSPDHAGQQIQLYHRINPSPFFTLISTTRTDAFGDYEFTRAEGIVESNRSWFVRGPDLAHSRTVHELVAAEVSLAASAVSGTTRHALIFSGHVTPNHAGNAVLLQQEQGGSNNWKTIGRAIIGPGSNFQLVHAWRVPGAYTLRALLPADPRNIASPSDPVPVVIQQTEVPDFTIQTSDPIVTNGSPYTISGTLYQAGTTTAEPNTSVSLFERRPAGGPAREVESTMTLADGSYSFPNLTSTTNELYQVRTTFSPHRMTAVLFEGVQDVLSINSSSSTSTVGGSATFTGNVSPDKAGHVIYLQRLGSDGNWHTVATGYVSPASDFQFQWTFGTPGTKQFRAQITGGPANVGGASAPTTVVVTLPPVSSLPTTS
jgi:hypothetical protein